MSSVRQFRGEHVCRWAIFFRFAGAGDGELAARGHVDPGDGTGALGSLPPTGSECWQRQRFPAIRVASRRRQQSALVWGWRARTVAAAAAASGRGCGRVAVRRAAALGACETCAGFTSGNLEREGACTPP